MIRFLLGLAVGFVMGWLALRKIKQPDLTGAELIEVDILG